MLWFKLKYKVKIKLQKYCERKRNTAKMKYSKRMDKPLTLGAFHLVKISGISGSAVNGTRFVGSSHWKIPRKSGKSKKVGPFSRLEFPNGMSYSISVSRSLYQFQVHRRVPRRTGVLRPNGTTFYQSEIRLLLPPKFPGFFQNGKRPLFWRKTSDRKRDTPDRKLLLSALEETTLK